MKITATASGGFTGRRDRIELRIELDTGCRADGRDIETLLDSLDFFGAGGQDATCEIGADLRRWEIMADDGRRCRTVTLTEDALAPRTGWQALIAHLRGAV